MRGMSNLTKFKKTTNTENLKNSKQTLSAKIHSQEGNSPD